MNEQLNNEYNLLNQMGESLLKNDFQDFSLQWENSDLPNRKQTALMMAGVENSEFGNQILQFLSNKLPSASDEESQGIVLSLRELGAKSPQLEKVTTDYLLTLPEKNEVIFALKEKGERYLLPILINEEIKPENLIILKQISQKLLKALDENRDGEFNTDLIKGFSKFANVSDSKDAVVGKLKEMSGSENIGLAFTAISELGNVASMDDEDMKTNLKKIVEKLNPGSMGFKEKLRIIHLLSGFGTKESKSFLNTFLSDDEKIIRDDAGEAISRIDQRK